jgi:hypothetical protein
MKIGSPRRVLIVGERFNQARSPSLDKLAEFDSLRWIEVAMRLGALANCRRRLERFGIKLATSITCRDGVKFPVGARALNLLPPAPLSDKKWPRELARKIGSLVMRHVSPSYDVTLLMGKRVAAAFGVDPAWDFGELIKCEVALLILPHPSGLNRVWNDSQEIERLASLVKGVIER